MQWVGEGRALIQRTVFHSDEQERNSATHGVKEPHELMTSEGSRIPRAEHTRPVGSPTHGARERAAPACGEGSGQWVPMGDVARKRESLLEGPEYSVS